jgi:UDP-3-O-[3-hydroxymyristoyl] N-acetylglucosamine deacetylase
MALRQIGSMRWQQQLTPEIFRKEVSRARSFGRMSKALAGFFYGIYKGEPLVRWAGPWNTAPIVGKYVLGGRRYPDEFVRHRVLDVVGDLALLGAPILGKVHFRHPSHEANYGLIQQLLKTPQAWDWVEVLPDADAA